MSAAVGKRSVICQECKYARKNLGEIAAECKAVRHMLDRGHVVHAMADGILVKVFRRTNTTATGEHPPF